MTRKLQAFTLIELMVVVAIIAILATLSVSNFSTAIRRTRNTNRVSDIQAVAKAMETCYDAMTGLYSGFTLANASTSVGTTAKFHSYSSTGAQDSSLFQKATLKCLNEDIVPTVADFNYSGDVVKSGGVESFYACAKLEQVDGWENVGNHNSEVVTFQDVGGQITWTLNGCEDASTNANKCYFCAVGSQ